MFVSSSSTKPMNSYCYYDKASPISHNLIEKMPNNLENCLSNDAQSEYCSFCRASAGPNSEPLIRCPECQVAAYCGVEHKNFDSKHHKLLCYQWRKNKPNKEALQSSSTENKTNGNSQNPVDFSVLPSTSGSTKTTTKSNNNNNNNNSITINKPTLGERIIQTADPDIQIIESGNGAIPQRKSEINRKRCHAFGFKEHSKNSLYKTTLQEHIKNLNDSGVTVNQHQAIALRLKYIAEHVIRSLNEYGWAVVDNFLGKSHCKHSYKEVEKLYEKGMFSAGQLMDSGTEDFNPHEIRSDQIYWFDSSDQRAKDSVTIRLLISMIDSVIVHFRDRIPPYKISGRSRAMIAVYPGNGTRYVKHVDNPVRDGRCITTIYYCNEDWRLNDHGGTLRLYPETSEMPMDIDPQADRLVFFWSDRRNPHEVLPVFRHRYAITIWYFDYEERSMALVKKKVSYDAATTNLNNNNNSTTNNKAEEQHSGIRVFSPEYLKKSNMLSGAKLNIENSPESNQNSGSETMASATHPDNVKVSSKMTFRSRKDTNNDRNNYSESENDEEDSNKSNNEILKPEKEKSGEKSKETINFDI